MILSKKDYLFYLEADRVALGKRRKGILTFLADTINPDHIWRFERLLRKVEYYKNVKSKHLTGKIVYFLLKLKFKRLSLKLGFTIPENVFGPGLAIVHYGTIVVNAQAKVGSNCRIHACTNIGASGGVSGAPIIGHNVYIGPGAKIYGNIKIGNDIAIAANSAVNKSFEENGILIGGVPAVKIKEITIQKIIKHV